jgi:hypothetical protein
MSINVMTLGGMAVAMGESSMMPSSMSRTSIDDYARTPRCRIPGPLAGHL